MMTAAGLVLLLLSKAAAMSWPQSQPKRAVPLGGRPPTKLLPPPPPPPRAETQKKRSSAELLVSKFKCPRPARSKFEDVQAQITELATKVEATVSQGSCI